MNKINQIRGEVRCATAEALRARTAFTVIGFTEFGIIAWMDNGPVIHV